jgi:hypothetical protein
VGRVESCGAVTLPLALIQPSAWKGNSAKLNFRFTEFSDVASCGVYALCPTEAKGGSRCAVFSRWLVRSTKTVMTRVEVGGTLFLVAVVGVLLTSREEGEKSA